MAQGEATTAAAGFQPPPYLASLIAAINDGAKAAQGGALLFLLVGLYLLATAFSASDEDLLLGKTVTISQIGASLPVSFSFAIAPLVFVFLHIYTLVRYDMLAANLRYFLAKLRQSVEKPEDREDCRQLLANVEFVLALAAPRGSNLYSRFWPWLFRAIAAVFPVLVLLLVQINALRYQSETILWVQRTWLVLDIAALAWFFRHNRLDGAVWPQERAASVRRWGCVLWAPAAVMLLNLVYLNVVPADADPKLVRYEPALEPSQFAKQHPHLATVSKYLTDVVQQPLDAGLCYQLNWGCRYLRVDHRTLVDKVWDDKAMAELHSGDVEPANALAGIEGLVLRGRSLRFAALDESRLYAADLMGTDLRGASLRRANLSAARLLGARLQGANLELAFLQGGNLSGAQLQGANLSDARLRGVQLFHAQLQAALLADTQLQGADLLAAQLQGAELVGTRLQGANLIQAQLQGARLNGTLLQGANLLQAQLQGAELSGTQLRGAYLNQARLWRVKSIGASDFTLADLRRVDFDTPPNDRERADLWQALDAVPKKARPRAEKRLEEVLVVNAPVPEFDFYADGPVLVSLPPDQRFERQRGWLIGAPTPEYREALASYLAGELAPTDPVIAVALGIRVSYLSDTPESKLLACRLVIEAAAGRVRLDRRWIDRLSELAKDSEPTCAAAAAAAK